MSSYWWECEKCGAHVDFPTATSSRGIAHFIRGQLLPSDWDQQALTRGCSACSTKTLRIAYDFPRAEKLTLRVVHIVGLNKSPPYLPMMWETYPTGDPETRWFDFKYLNGLKTYGLNRPAVFGRSELAELFALYKAKTGAISFP